MARRIPSRRWHTHSPEHAHFANRSNSAKNVEVEEQVSDSRPKTRFGCLYFPHYAAWIAYRIDRSLIRQSVAVCHRNIVVSLSPEAIQSGVQLGWTVNRAQSRNAHLVVVPLDAAACATSWEVILRSLYDLTPCIEPKREGLLFFDPPTNDVDLLQISCLVQGWKCQAGLASDRPTAELAAYAARRGSVLNIPDGNEAALLNRLPVGILKETDLVEDTIQRLKWFGLDTIGKLRTIKREELNSQFDKHDSKLLWYFACAGTPKALNIPTKTYRLPALIAERFVFDAPASSPSHYSVAVMLLSKKCTDRLNGMGASLITVALTTKGGQYSSCALLRESVSNPRLIARRTEELIADILKPHDDIEIIELRLGKISSHASQGGLFDDRSLRRIGAAEKNIYPIKLANAIRNVEARFGAVMQRFQLRDQHAALREECYHLIPALEGEKGI